MANHTTINPASLLLVLSITFLGSMGTAVVTSGIAFITDQGLGYSGTQNLVFALVLGGVYIPAALISGPMVRWGQNKWKWLSTKRVLIGIMLLLTIVAQGPTVANQINPDLTEWAVWIMGMSYMAATGIQWPIIEAYLSGGRQGNTLRKAIGKFNIIWSSAMVLAYWMMAPMIESMPFVILSLLGGLHIVIVGIVSKLPPEPAKHYEEDHEPHPPVYVPLLMVFRMMLIASYIILSVMIPLMPSIEDRLGLDEFWWTPIASTWLVVRVVFFVIFERWHGWHGHWWTPWLGMGGMILGFAAAMMSPMIGGAEPGLASGTVNTIGVLVLVGGLSLAGIGIAATYYGALYYAMAVGGSDIDSGGKHEALIGAGYTIGPLCGLVGGFIYQGGLGVIAVTSVVVLTMVGIAIIKARKRPPHPPLL